MSWREGKRREGARRRLRGQVARRARSKASEAATCIQLTVAQVDRPAKADGKPPHPAHHIFAGGSHSCDKLRALPSTVNAPPLPHSPPQVAQRRRRTPLNPKRARPHNSPVPSEVADRSLELKSKRRRRRRRRRRSKGGRTSRLPPARRAPRQTRKATTPAHSLVRAFRGMQLKCERRADREPASRGLVCRQQHSGGQCGCRYRPHPHVRPRRMPRGSARCLHGLPWLRSGAACDPCHMQK